MDNLTQKLFNKLLAKVLRLGEKSLHLQVIDYGGQPCTYEQRYEAQNPRRPSWKLLQVPGRSAKSGFAFLKKHSSLSLLGFLWTAHTGHGRFEGPGGLEQWPYLSRPIMPIGAPDILRGVRSYDHVEVQPKLHPSWPPDLDEFAEINRRCKDDNDAMRHLMPTTMQFHALQPVRRRKI